MVNVWFKGGRPRFKGMDLDRAFQLEKLENQTVRTPHPRKPGGLSLTGLTIEGLAYNDEAAMLPIIGYFMSRGIKYPVVYDEAQGCWIPDLTRVAEGVKK